MGGFTDLTGQRIEAETPGAIASHPSGLHVSAAGADRRQCSGDPAGDELIAARRLGALAALDPALAVIAGTVPGLLSRQKLGEQCGLPPRGEHL
jgi:hypothetical protein